MDPGVKKMYRIRRWETAARTRWPTLVGPRSGFSLHPGTISFLGTTVAFGIKTMLVDDRCTLALQGDVELTVAPDIIQLGAVALSEPQTQTLVIDLGAVTLIDFAGLASLVRLSNMAGKLNKQLHLSRIPHRVQTLFQITGLDTLFMDTHATPERCASYEFSAGRCQLVTGHDGPHATHIDGTYPSGSCLTWHPGELNHWPVNAAHRWVSDLPWAAGLRPAGAEPSAATPV